MTIAAAKALVEAIIQILFSGLLTIAPLLGNGISEIIGHLLFTYNEGVITADLSIFGAVMLAFWAVSLAIGIGRLLVKFITGGAKNRYM